MRAIQCAMVCAVLFWSAAAVSKETDSPVKTIDNKQLVDMLRAGIPLDTITKMVSDNPSVKISDTPEEIIEISKAAQDGGMEPRERKTLLNLVIDLANKEKTRIKGLIDQYMNVCINGDKTEYESMMRQIMREGRMVVTELRKHIEEENELKRQGVVDALGRLGEKSALVVKDVKLMLGDRDPGVREKAAEALAKIAPPEIVDELIEAIDRRTVEHLDGMATALGKLGSEKAVKTLSKLLVQTSDPAARRAAAAALGDLRTKDTQAVNALLDAVLDDQDPQLRSLSAWALGYIGERRAVGYIIRSFQRHEQKPGRDELLKQLRNFKSLKVVDFLIPLTDKDAPDIRRAAQETLQVLTGSDATSREGWEAVREVIRDRPDWNTDTEQASPLK
jgi:HEAT repeat protein